MGGRRIGRPRAIPPRCRSPKPAAGRPPGGKPTPDAATPAGTLRNRRGGGRTLQTNLSKAHARIARQVGDLAAKFHPSDVRRRVEIDFADQRRARPAGLRSPQGERLPRSRRRRAILDRQAARPRMNLVDLPVNDDLAGRPAADVQLDLRRNRVDDDDQFRR